MRKVPSINYKIYQADFTGYKYSICFVGNPNFCLKMICDLTQIYNNKFHLFCTDKDFQKSLKKIEKENLIEDIDLYKKIRKNFSENELKLAQIYNASRINICYMHTKSVPNQVFETIASGGFLITNEHENIGKYFEISKELETFKNTEDLIDKIDFYLQNLNIAQNIAQKGYFEILRRSQENIQRLAEELI